MSINLLSPEAASAEGGTTGGWVDYANGSTITNSTTFAADGTHCIKAVTTAPGDLGICQPYAGNAFIPAVAGSTYSAVASFQAGATARTCYVYITWYNAAKTAIGDSADGAHITSTTSGFTQSALTGVTAPALTVYMTLRLYVVAAATAETVYFDKMGLFCGSVSTWSPGRIRGIGAATAATGSATAPAPAYPAGITAGDMIVLVCGGKPYTASVATPSGYTAQGTTTNGTTLNGADTGSTKVATFTKEAAGTESGTLTMAVTLGDTWWAQIIVLAKNDSADTWSVGTTTGSDTTSNTTFAAAMAADPGLAADDICILCAVGSTDAVQTWSAPTLTATGTTSQVELLLGYQPLITTGNDSGGMVAIAPVLTGPSSAAPTWGATLSTGTNALFSAAMVRLRSVPPAVTVMRRIGKYIC